MKLSGLAVIAPLLVFALSNGCSSGDDDDGAAGSGGSAMAGTSGSGTAGTSAGTAGTSAGTGGSSAGAGGSSAGTGGSAAGTGGSSGGSAGTSSGATDSPSDTTQAGIDAFLDADSYKTADWVNTGAAVDTDSHGSVISYFNKTARQSKADGDSTLATGSMVVKELLDGTTVVGHAVMLRTTSSWIYYCDSSVDGLCEAAHTAGTVVYGTSAATTGCGCHGAGTIITPIPPP